MCDFEYDESCPVWSEEHRTARRQHECSGCGEVISPGHSYTRTAVLWDGSWGTWKHCLRCSTLVAALKPRLGACFGTETLDLNCGEVWEDPPEHIAALAFVLPGEDVTALLNGQCEEGARV